jgi:hypothetical protein
MAVEKWVSGAVSAYATAFNAADLNSLPNGSAVLSSIADIANGTNLDIFAALSISLGSITTVAPSFLGVYYYPLNQDGTTYGDKLFASGAQVALAPSATYWVGNIIVGVGTTVITGTLDRIIIPPRSGRFLAYNQLGATLAASANVAKYQTYNRSIV